MFKAIHLYAKNLESGESHEICGGGILSGGKYYYEYYKKNGGQPDEMAATKSATHRLRRVVRDCASLQADGAVGTAVDAAARLRQGR